MGCYYIRFPEEEDSLLLNRFSNRQSSIVNDLIAPSRAPGDNVEEVPHFPF
jgi:hypothetical protein